MPATGVFVPCAACGNRVEVIVHNRPLGKQLNYEDHLDFTGFLCVLSGRIIANRFCSVCKMQVGNVLGADYINQPAMIVNTIDHHYCGEPDLCPGSLKPPYQFP